ncbi:DUF2480 family protein [Balneola sp. MJW-20]|uniref:DUF2480 family protein n=1 Tax=Gracilimonas aurantiaca TaxID=3234185 RepID=UPI0034661D3A
MEETIVNKVKANQKLITLDLAKLFYDKTPVKELDIKQFLFQELLLKEKDFRSHLKNYDWSQYQDAYLRVYCSTDAIIAPWAWMLLTSYASEHALDVFHMPADQLQHTLYRRNIEEHDWDLYKDKFVLLKGCGDIKVPDSIYLLVTNKLKPVARKIMYGEACSNVPVWTSR